MSYIEIFFYVVFTIMIFVHVRAWYFTNRMYGGLSTEIIADMFVFVRKSFKRWMLPLASIALFLLLWVFSLNSQIPIPSVIFYGCLVIGLSTFSWNIQPPTILLLASSKEESIDLFLAIKHSILGLRIVALLAPSQEKITFYMDNFRTVDDSEWRTVAYPLMEKTPIIVVDTRQATSGVVEEVQRILSYENLFPKTVFVTFASGYAPVLDKVTNKAIGKSIITVGDNEASDLLHKLVKSRISGRGIVDYDEKQVMKFERNPYLPLLMDCPITGKTFRLSLNSSVWEVSSGGTAKCPICGDTHEFNRSNTRSAPFAEAQNFPYA